MAKLDRRRFLLGGGIAISATALAACSNGATPPATVAPAPTQAPAATTAAATAGATATGASSAASTSVLAKPTPSAIKAEVEILSQYGKGSVDYDDIMWTGQQFQKWYPNVTTKVTLSNQQADQLRLTQGHPAQIGNVSGSYASFTTSIPYIKEGYIVNLDDAMKQVSWDTPGKSWWDTINPIVRPLLQVPGYPGVWSFPREVTTLLFFYNVKHFQKVGVQPPTTWDELDQAAAALKKAGIPPFAEDGVAAHGYMAWWLWELWAKLMGNDVSRQAIVGEHSFTEPGFVQGATMVKDFLDKGYFVNGFAGMDHTGSQMVFYQGGAAMILVGSWVIGEMANAIPKDFEQNVFRFPTVAGGKGDPKHLFGTSNVLGVAAKSTNPEVAVEWGRFFNSVQVNDKRSKDLNYQSAILGTTPPPMMPEANKIFVGSDRMDIFGNGDLVGQTKEAQTRFNQYVGDLFEKGLDPKKFCEQVDSNFRSFFKENPDVLQQVKPFVSGIPGAQKL